MSELFPECRAFLEHELKKMEGCALTTTDHGKQNWLCKCLKEIKAMSIEPEPKQPPPETIDEYCGQPPGSFKQFVQNHPDPDMIAFTPPPVDVRIKEAIRHAVYRISLLPAYRWSVDAIVVIDNKEQHGAIISEAIAQLEQENERLNERARVNADLWHKAEARVKELEARLEAALKLTTENSIDYVNKV